MTTDHGTGLSAEDQQVFQVLDEAARLYEEYIAIASVTAAATWDDDEAIAACPSPDLPLTLVLDH